MDVGDFDPGKVGNINSIAQLFIPFEEERSLEMPGIIAPGTTEFHFDYTKENLIKTKQLKNNHVRPHSLQNCLQ